MQIHHIVPEGEGGEDSFENGIPLCLMCHAEVGAYNPRHPIGRRLGPSELRMHRDQWFEIASRADWHESKAIVPLEGESLRTVEELLEQLRGEAPWKAGWAEYLGRVVRLERRELEHLVAGLSGILRESDDEDLRWSAAAVIERLVAWEPSVIDGDLIDRMSRDPFFSVRSCAAVSYYELAGAAPKEVPFEALFRLADWNEDWYVATPATGAVLRLARARTAALDILAAGLVASETEARLYAARALDRAIHDAPNALRDDIATLMCASDLSEIQEVGHRWREAIETRRKNHEPADPSMF